MDDSEKERYVQLLSQIRTEFDRLRWQAQPIQAQITHRASNAEAEGVKGYPTLQGKIVAMQGAGNREFRQMVDSNGNTLFRDDPIVDVEGNPIVNSAGDGFDVVMPASRSVEFVGRNEDFPLLNTIVKRAGRIFAKLRLPFFLDVLDGWSFSTPNGLWWAVLFETAWSGRHPLLTAEKSLWLPGENPNSYLPYNLKQVQSLLSSMGGRKIIPENWRNRLPDAFISEIPDVVAASVDVVDFLLTEFKSDDDAEVDESVDESEEKSEILIRRRFAIALSFPGEHRSCVKKIANNLKNALGEQRVFYDMYHQEELAVNNLDLKLQQFYGEESDLIVVFACKEYNEKEWCGLEWRAIRDLMKRKSRADEDVIVFCLDDSDIEGLLSIDGYIDITNESQRKVADIILRRWSAKK